MSTSWFWNAVVAMLAMTPMFFVIGVLERQYGLKSEVSAVFWMGGVAIGIALWLALKGRGGELIPQAPHMFMLAAALILGAVANICLFQSFVSAPNPGLTVAIVNANAILLLLLGIPLAMFLPQYFTQHELSWQQWGGVVSVIIGVMLIGIK